MDKISVKTFLVTNWAYVWLNWICYCVRQCNEAPPRTDGPKSLLLLLFFVWLLICAFRGRVVFSGKTIVNLQKNNKSAKTNSRPKKRNHSFLGALGLGVHPKKSISRFVFQFSSHPIVVVCCVFDCWFVLFVVGSSSVPAVSNGHSSVGVLPSQPMSPLTSTKKKKLTYNIAIIHNNNWVWGLFIVPNSFHKDLWITCKCEVFKGFSFSYRSVSVKCLCVRPSVRTYSGGILKIKIYTKVVYWGQQQSYRSRFWKKYIKIQKNEN